MGEVFAGRYELVDPIGRGGVGAVWRTWDHRRRRYVAAKVLQQRDAHSLLRFVREQALRIDHPHVLAPTSWAADDDKVLFTMDLVAGGSLAHLVGDYGPLPPAFVCTLLDQLLSGLAAVHAEGVVHRDIKPANVLLEATGRGRPKLRLSDFGIAMRLGEPRLTETDLVVGTPGYIAPEQLMGAEPDFPADLFATGLVALYLLQGAKPDAKALVEYFMEHGTPSAPKGVPEPLWQVLAALLQPDPQNRFRTATGARKALLACAELLPEPDPEDEVIEIFDQLGPLPPGFGPDGPLVRSPAVTVGRGGAAGSADTARAAGAPERPPGTGAVAAGSTGPDTGSAGPGIPGTGFTDPTPGTGLMDPTPGTGLTDSHPETGRTGSRTGGPAGPGIGSVSPAASGTGSAVSDPRLASRQGTGPVPGPDGGGPPAVAAPPLTMSDTGSFRLPPPQAIPSAPPAPPVPPPSFSPAPPPSAGVPPAPVARADASTASYTARDPQQVPVPAREGLAHHPRHAVRRPRRPGPPARVAVPLLLLALACYAVGFWALTRL
ncbi:serine/threonine protein kinase [Streptomyces sp. F-3]|uniref:non-specific serine/threonine protein kinase n=1 Tax=Streptomyces thermogriseus TaxID=75292 RepID=A0ABP4DKR3_9ACTN|nr:MULTISPECIES: protein kinase [unclassified Streptomyces]MDN5380861.1 protein kinase [Streptomyces sp. LB8]GAT84320.1 serine/threonine protein kinase [Streptomyces sp. F-3]